MDTEPRELWDEIMERDLQPCRPSLLHRLLRLTPGRMPTWLLASDPHSHDAMPFVVVAVLTVVSVAATNAAARLFGGLALVCTFAFFFIAAPLLLGPFVERARQIERKARESAAGDPS